MNRIEKKALITQLFKDLQAIEEVDQQVYKLFGNFEGEFMVSYEGLINNYTKLVAEQVEDKGDWLMWYAYENEFGVRKMEAGLGNGEDTKPICNVDDLLEVMDA